MTIYLLLVGFIGKLDPWVQTLVGILPAHHEVVPFVLSFKKLRELFCLSGKTLPGVAALSDA